MIGAKFQIFLIVALVIYFVSLYKLLKDRYLELKYTLIWIFAGLLMLIMAIFPKLLDKIAAFFGIYSSVNALFALAIFFILLILMSLTPIASKLNDKTKKVIQQSALLEKRIKELENMQIDNDAESKNDDGDKICQ